MKVGRRGLIPAHAGKTNTFKLAAIVTQAHPRACGENGTTLEDWHWALGSSPRMRGKREMRLLMRQLAGLIPAHAGKTLAAFPIDCNNRAHPRACGENVGLKPGSSELGGSSPRMRGKRTLLFNRYMATRLIPAHAGKTGFTQPTQRLMRAHPRACGENVVIADPSFSSTGSSPRMRGKLLQYGSRVS